MLVSPIRKSLFAALALALPIVALAASPAMAATAKKATHVTHRAVHKASTHHTVAHHKARTHTTHVASH